MKTNYTETLKRKSHLIVCLVAVGLGLAVYSNTLQSSFHFDDFRAIVENKEIKNFANPRAIFNAYNTRFLVGLSFSLNYLWHGLDTYGYHLFNTFIHILTSLLLYMLVLNIFKTPVFISHSLKKREVDIALIATFIFLLHPVQTQAVSYIWQRTTSLASFFYLAGITGYLIAKRSRRKTPFYILSLCSIVAAMLTKEIAFTAPFVLIFCEFVWFPGESWRKKAWLLAPFLATLLIIPTLLIRSTPQTMGITQSAHLYFDDADPTWRGRRVDFTRGAQTQDISRKDYFLTECRAMITYLRLIVLPVKQNLDYDLPISGKMSDPKTLFSFLFMTTFFVGGITLLRGRLLLFFSFAWFFLTISVESSIIPVLDPINEHRLYLPMVGASIFLATLFVRILTQRQMIIISLTLFATLSFLTYKRNAVWRDNVTLWEDIVKKSPGKVRAHISLAKAYLDQGLFSDAILAAAEALKIDPENAQGHITFANAHNLNGDITVAAEHFEKGLAIDPYDIGARYNLAVIRQSHGSFRAAEKHLEKILALDETYVNAYLALGALASQRDQKEKAIMFFKKALKLNPDDPVAYHNIGVTYGQMGNPDKEIFWHQKAIAIDRGYIKAWRELGLAYEREGRFEMAEKTYRVMIEGPGEKGFAYYRLGVLAALRGDIKSAGEFIRQALEFLPADADLLYDAAVFYYQNADEIRARKMIAELKNIGRDDLANRILGAIKEQKQDI